MAIPRHIVDEVRARTDIAELVGRTVTLRRAGRTYSGLCPFHNEKTPSFNVVPDKGIFHCFGCGEGGDAFAFLMKSRGVSFFEAVKELGDAAGVVVEEREMSNEERQRLQRRADLYDVCELTARFFSDTLLARPEGQPGRDYLVSRGISLETQQKYRLGFAPDAWDRLANHLQKNRIPSQLAVSARVVGKSDRSDRIYDLFRNRVTFPILDDRGRVVAFGGRLLPDGGDGPKYLNSPESDVYNKSRTLYGLSWARLAVQRKDRLILVEGYFDAVSLWQAGFEEAVATCGTALTPAHLEVVARLTRKVVALFDGDEAGLKAATKSMDLFLDAGVEAKRLELGVAKDPDEFIQKFGAPAFDAALSHSVPLLELVLQRTIQREGSTAAGRARALEAVVPIFRRLSRAVRSQAEGLAGQLLGISVAELHDRVGTIEESSAAPQTMAAPARWVPTRELSHILWLLLHFPQKVAPVLADTDPELLTDRRTVLEAIVALASGAPLGEVADPSRDADLARALRVIAARPAEYTEERAEFAARQLIAKLEVARIEARIIAINGRIAACLTSGDKSSYRSLAQEVIDLKQRQTALNAIVAGRTSRTTA
jgi:DNA primase